eukprot:COSAG01_NODE_1043_length_11954_cov_9.077014_7_plen_116_part_00
MAIESQWVQHPRHGDPIDTPGRARGNAAFGRPARPMGVAAAAAMAAYPAEVVVAARRAALFHVEASPSHADLPSVACGLRCGRAASRAAVRLRPCGPELARHGYWVAVGADPWAR